MYCHGTGKKAIALSEALLRKLEEESISAAEIIKTEDDEIEALTATTTKKGNQKKIVKKGANRRSLAASVTIVRRLDIRKKIVGSSLEQKQNQNR